MEAQTFTPTQINYFKKYERVRKGGKWNMFDPHARQATGLTSEAYSFVMKNYEDLQKAAESK